MPTPFKSIWSAIKTLARWAVALLILFEEWGWRPLARGLGRVLRWTALDRLERRIAALGPYVALGVLCVPALALLPIKIGAWWLIGLGRIMLGLSLLMLGKVLGTAVVARLFLLTRPQLMRLGWFARGYGRWIAWKRRVVASLLESAGWIAARSLATRVRAWWPPR
jgi:hypothetical protein